MTVPRWIFLRKRNISKHIFYFQQLFFPKITPFVNNVGKYNTNRHATDNNITYRVLLPCWISKATDRLKIFNNYYFCTAKIFTLKSYNITFIRTMYFFSNIGSETRHHDWSCLCFFPIHPQKCRDSTASFLTRPNILFTRHSFIVTQPKQFDASLNKPHLNKINTNNPVPRSYTAADKISSLYIQLKCITKFFPVHFVTVGRAKKSTTPLALNLGTRGR